MARVLSAAFWLWLLATVLVSGYLQMFLVVWCFADLGRDTSIGALALLTLLAASPVMVFAAFYISLRPWGNRASQTLVAATFTAPFTFLALIVRFLSGTGM